ncbi:MAG: sugar phosphate isomerase/epimerase [Candidatus Eremiobacteraeota bacterium]|nr:sugar phosphate isomerase/epimerase [Candidatus Eremiobacteraeota bacterium]
MKLGFPNNPKRCLAKEIEWIGSHGFDFVDLFLEESATTPDKIDCPKISDLLLKYNLERVGHTAWYLPIGSPMRTIREAAVKEAARYFEVFQKLGVRLVTIHAHWPGGGFSVKEGLAFQSETLRKLVKTAKDYHLSLMYEPVDTSEDKVQNVTALLNEVDGLLFHLDIGHANLWGRKPGEFIKALHGKLVHVHLHDNTRNMDLHLPMGCGTVDWEDTLKTLKYYYDGTITIEVFSRDRDYALLTRDKVRKLWERF